MSQQELMQQHCWHVAGPGYTRDHRGTADPRLPVEAAAAPLPVVTLPPFKATDVAKGTPVNQPPVLLLHGASCNSLRDSSAVTGISVFQQCLLRSVQMLRGIREQDGGVWF